jgi:hypothetical protein
MHISALKPEILFMDSYGPVSPLPAATRPRIGHFVAILLHGADKLWVRRGAPLTKQTCARQIAGTDFSKS